MAGQKQDIEPGYGFQDEFAVEHDHIIPGFFRFAVWTIITLILLVVIAVQWAKVEGFDALAENTVVVPPPAIRSVRAEAVKKLTRYEVIDAENGVYQIPIERAMALEASENAED